MDTHGAYVRDVYPGRRGELTKHDERVIAQVCNSNFSQNGSSHVHVSERAEKIRMNEDCGIHDPGEFSLITN